MRRNNKKRNEQVHFQRRSLERLGVILNSKELVKEIQNKKLPFIRKDSNRVTLWKKQFMGTDYVIVYDKNRKEIITIYPMEELQVDNNLFM